MYVYDVFGMIPPPSENDTPEVHDRYQVIVTGRSKGINGDKYYDYRNNLYEVVCRNLSVFGIDVARQSISLVKGLIQDTMILDEPIAFAHIDVDWYEPVMISLQRIWPLLVSGGSIVLDDYYDWGGCKKAVDEFLALVPDLYILDDDLSSLKITKV
jgi:asparagine synthase (glutamine-hydrolysing)